MSNETVKNTETVTEETSVSSERAGTPDVEVSSEKTVEHTEETSGDAKSDGTTATESTVNVKVENNIPSAQAAVAHDPNKNYEAAQPVVDPIV